MYGETLSVQTQEQDDENWAVVTLGMKSEHGGEQ